MTVARLLIPICAFFLCCAHSACGDEIRRLVDMSYVCGRYSMGRILFSQDSQKHSYEITAWSDPFTENLCYKRSDVPQGCVPTELYDFSFRCGSAGSVHISDFYANSQMGKTFGAHREGDHIVLNGGQQRVLTSQRYGDCFGKGLSPSDISRCIETSDQHRLDQIWINLPAGRVPLPSEAQLTTRAIGDDCGNGLFCGPGNKCSAGGGCVAVNSVDCGNGKSCAAGSKCSLGGGCIPDISVDCGSGHWCPVGQSCGANNSCVGPATIPEGGRRFAFESNSWPVVLVGTLFSGFLSWLFGTATNALSDSRPGFWQKVAINSISLFISGVVLYYFGFVNEFKLLTIPIFAGVSVAVIQGNST